MSSIHQTVIIRTDLFNLPEDIGLLAAQVAHIHFELVRKMIDDGDFEGEDEDVRRIVVPVLDVNHDDLQDWIAHPYLHVRQVPNAEALEYLRQKAKENDVPVSVWKDTINVRFSPTTKHPFPDITVGISIGPADADAIRTVIEDLPWL